MTVLKESCDGANKPINSSKTLVSIVVIEKGQNDKLNSTQDSSIAFLSKLKMWIRASLEFSVLRKTPGEDDIILIQAESPVFLSLGELVKLCENSAGNKMIYEAWLNNALANVYSRSRSLNALDSERLIVYFKSYHGIDDEGELEITASVALSDAAKALYG